MPGSSGGSWALYQMPASAMPSASTTALSALASYDPAVRIGDIDLTRTYTNSFALRAKVRFMAGGPPPALQQRIVG